MAQCRYQLLLIQLSCHWLLTEQIFIHSEKKPLLTVNIVCHSSTASWTFSPTSASSFIRVLEQTHLPPFDERKKERGGRTSNYSRLSVDDSYQGVGMGLGGCEGERLRYEMILRSRTDFNYQRNFQVARGRSAYELKRTQSNSLKDKIWVPQNLTQYKPSICVRLRAKSIVSLMLETRVCDYLGFAIGCCGCQSDPVGNIDDATRKSTKFLAAMTRFSSSHKNCDEHWIALICGPSKIDFVLRKVEKWIKCFILVKKLRFSFLLWKNKEMNALGFVDPKRSMKFRGWVFLCWVWTNACRYSLQRIEWKWNVSFSDRNTLL